MLIAYVRMVYAEIGNRLLVLLLLLLLAAFFEAISISMILPLLQGEGGTDNSTLSKALDAMTDTLGIGTGTTSILIFMVVLFFIRGAFMIAQSMYQAKIISEHLVQIRTRIITALFRVSYRYLISRDTGYFTNAVTGELERVNFTLRQFGTLAVATTTTLVYLALALLFQPAIFLFILILLIPIGAIAIMVNRRTREASIQHSRHAGEHQSLLVEAVQQSKYLMATGRTEAVTNRIISETRQLGRLYRRLMRLGNISLYGFEPFAVLVLAGIVWYYTQVLDQPMSEVIFLVVLFFQGSKSVLAVQPSYRKFLQSAGSLELYKKLSEELAENSVEADPDALPPDMSGDINFVNVSVSYPGQTGEALNGISFAIPPRKTVALVGPSGAGKSTVANLLTGLIEPSDGEITLAGTPYSQLNIDLLRSKIAYVTQESVVFRGSMLENVTMWDPDSRTAQARELLDRVGLSHLIGRSDDDDRSDVRSTGADISGGERQRLSIARELYRQFDILILDEATSSLDSELESRIDELLRETRGKATIVIIAHRLSTIRHADVIHVLDSGRIVESGSYEELSRGDGPFAKMVQSQVL